MEGEVFNSASLEQYSLLAVQYALDHGPRLILAVITLFVGLRLIKTFVNVLSKSMETRSFDETLRPFITNIVGWGLKALLIISVASMVGIETTSFIAVMGAAGLAIGLALQGSLANFAGGILILVFKPFKVGDVIDAQGNLGMVERIDILHTHIKTFDNRVIIMPNGALANSNVTNLSKKETRRVEMSVGVAYGTDLQKVRNVILDTLAVDERILSDPEPVVKFVNFGDSSLDLIVRCWTSVDNFWPVYWDNMEAINNAFNANGIEIPFPQRDLHIKSNHQDL
jgi:small conductance mechanosensitive channel